MKAQELFDAYLNGDLTEAETSQLQALLQTEDGGRAFAEYTMETSLMVTVADQVLQETPVAPISRSRFWVIPAAAAIVLAGLLLFLVLRPAPPLPNRRTVEAAPHLETISITDAGNAILRSGEQLTVGQVLQVHELDLESGACSFRLAEGADLRIMAGTRLSFESSGKLRLYTGWLLASLKGTKQSITIHTPYGDLRDIGTRFHLIFGNEQAIVQVGSGVVEMRNAKGELGRLKKGEHGDMTSNTLVRTHPEPGFPDGNGEFSTENVRTLLPWGARWRYSNNPKPPSPNWFAPNYDDSAWPSGKAKLGYGEGDEVTLTADLDRNDPKVITSWFRTQFQVNTAVIGAAQIHLLADDSARVYLNGKELMRTNLPDGSITWETLSLQRLNPERSIVVHHFPGELLHRGTNTLAVEVHQCSRNTSDLSFDLTCITRKSNDQ